MQESDPNYRKKFNDFYLSLIEFLQVRLDLLSLEEGRLVQTYEVFDLAGLGYHMMTMTVINFTKDILLNYSAHYPQSFRKAAIVNAPPWLPRMWRMISAVLPNSVKAKVSVGLLILILRFCLAYNTVSLVIHRCASWGMIITRSWRRISPMKLSHGSTPHNLTLSVRRTHRRSLSLLQHLVATSPSTSGRS